MLCRIVCVLFVLFVSANAQRGGRRHRSDTIVAQLSGSGNGLYDTDDEDLQTSGSEDLQTSGSEDLQTSGSEDLQTSGSGSGLDDIDDEDLQKSGSEDLQTSGSGSGHGVLPDTKESMTSPPVEHVDDGSGEVESAVPPGSTTTTTPSTSTPITTRLGTTAPQPDVTTKINIIIGGGQDQGDPIESNDTGDQNDPELEVASDTHIIRHPGILAAVIGGSVVLSLCAILLVMFIVYRMRIKYKRSYAQD